MRRQDAASADQYGDTVKRRGSRQRLGQPNWRGRKRRDADERAGYADSDRRDRGKSLGLDNAANGARGG